MLNNISAQKDVQIGVRLDRSTKDQLDRLAAQQQRTVSDYVRQMILRALRRRRNGKATAR